MTGDSSDGDSSERATNWESIARAEVAASLHRSHRQLYEEAAAIAETIAEGSSVSSERIESVRMRYLDCDERLAVALERIDDLDPDAPAERIDGERRRIDRELRGLSKAARTDSIGAERIEKILDVEYPPTELVPTEHFPSRK